MPPGSYTAVATTPAGLVPVLANVGVDDSVDSDFVDGSASLDIVTLKTTELDTGFAVPSGTVGGFLFDDVNQNDIFDDGDAFVPGAAVTVADSRGGSQTATTGADGAWSLLVAVGAATVTYVCPAGYSEVEANVGEDDTVDSDVTDGVAVVEVVLRENVGQRRDR